MMIEAQALEYKDTDDSDGPKVTIYFPEHKAWFIDTNENFRHN